MAKTSINDVTQHCVLLYCIPCTVFGYTTLLVHHEKASDPTVSSVGCVYQCNGLMCRK